MGSRLRLGLPSHTGSVSSTSQAAADPLGATSAPVDHLNDPLLGSGFAPLTDADRTSTSFKAGNDNFTFGLKQPDEHLVGVGKFGDDDGKTSELTATHRRERDRGNGRTDLLSFGARHDTLTKDGNWQGDDRYQRHKGERTDVAEFGIQMGRTQERGDGVTDHFALGAGIQGVGNLGGYTMQDKVHEIKGSGGRGDRLQQNYTSDGVDSVHPTLSGGYARELELGHGVSAYGGVRGKVPLGSGYGWGEGVAGLRGHHEDPLNGALGLASPSHLSWNVSGTAGYAGASDAIDFNDDYNKGYAGMQAGASLGFGPMSLEAGVRSGGLTGEALVGSLGLRFGASVEDILDTFK